MAIYKLITTNIEVEDEIINTYGIACINDGIITQCIHDISPDKEFVEQTIDTFNKNNLSPTHFSDAVDDALI